MFTDLTPLVTLSAPVIEFLVCQVASQICNKNGPVRDSAVSTQLISETLEGEGLAWSNNRIEKVVSALKTLTQTYISAKAAIKNAEGDLTEAWNVLSF